MQKHYRYSKHLLVVFILVSAALGLMRFDSLQIGASYDDAHYIILAESLSSGQGYQLINFPRPQIERAFPPGWSLLLAPLTFLFPGNYSVLKIFSLLLSLSSILLTYKIFSKRLSSPFLEMLTGLVALNPLLVGASVTVMSESAYLFFSLLALYLFDNWKPSPQPALSLRERRMSDWLIALIAFLAFYTQLIRTIGISLFLALIIFLLFTRRFRETGIVVGVFIAGTLLQGWVSGVLISSGYQSQVFNSSVPEKLGQMGSNALGYFNETLAGSLIPVFGSNLTSYLGAFNLEFIPALLNILVLSFIVLGAASRKRIEPLDVYAAIYLFGILAFWNPRVGSVKARFLIPIIPLLYFYFLQGLAWAAEKVNRNRINFGTSVAAVLIALILLARNVQDWRSPVMNQMTDLSIGASWVAENAPPDAIVMVNEPVPSYPHVRRKTINFPKQGQDLRKYLDNQGIDYIIIAPPLGSPRSTKLDKGVEKYLSVLDAEPVAFVAVFSDPENNVTVYEYKNQEQP
ncbi:MAG: hypothetical protein C4557_04275 [Anaerolineaceae bacterium]|jgi:hypothetical protein|nr:MAG: hypothetical protein C4557_04275 [Anaerolineaceae bacterium]